MTVTDSMSFTQFILFWVVYSFFFSRRRRHTRLVSDWSSDVCSSDLVLWLSFSTITRALSSRPDPCRSSIRSIVSVISHVEGRDQRLRDDPQRPARDLARLAEPRERVLLG